MTRVTAGALVCLAAVLGLLTAGSGSGAAAPMAASPAAAPAAVARTGAAALRPDMVRKLIPFGDRRKREMGSYSRRHYGQWGYRLRDPRVIVEHYTDGPSMMSAWWTMADNTRNLGELPGVCTHFIVDTDGTVYRTVPLGLRCRHTIGLNQTAVGIEHVGTSDRQVMHDDPQRRASLRLTLWLMARFGIPVKNVIGHGESLMEPLRHELYPSWKCLTHTDFSHRTMRHYRHRLRRLAREAGVRVGRRPHWVDIGC